MVYLILQRTLDIVVTSFSALPGSAEQHLPDPFGVFPTSFTEQDAALIADYGQRSIGKDHLCGAKSLVAHPLLALRATAARTGTSRPAKEVQRGVQTAA